MRTEHLSNVHVGWVTAGWLIAAAVTSLVILAPASVGAVPPDGALAAGWTVLAVVLGFYVGGMFTGFRSMDAPILHGIAIGIFSLVAWLVLNLVATGISRAPWQTLTPPGAAAALLLQMVAAVAGAWTGHRIAEHGGPDLTD